MSLGTIGVGVVRTAWAITVVSDVGGIFVRVFALWTTFTFVWRRRFVRSGAIQRIKILVSDFLDASFFRKAVSQVFSCE